MKDRTKNSIKPFWSWNDKLEKEELQRQIQLMKDNGIEGFFMHARGGLRTEYMSDEWFDMIEACLDKADELGMQAWAYDENGWPSGFADGRVPAKGVEFQQKYIHCVEYEGGELPENIVAVFSRGGNTFTKKEIPEKGDVIFRVSVNPYYIDVFNKDAIKEFLTITHEEYYKRFGERFGTSLKGFFTDEPQYGNGFKNKSEWSHLFPDMFKERYGYDLIDNLPALFYKTENYTAVRNDFHVMVSDVFCTSFLKQMYDWCTDHNCMITGHLINEQDIVAQMRGTNGVMPGYEYFHEPGVDWLGRFIASPCNAKQLGSVAAQLGLKTLTESFALCGWDVSLNELKFISQWQYLNGVTSLCPHLEGYSIRGERKRDYPASVYSQLPWFRRGYLDFADYFTTLGAMLDDGKDIAPLLVLHPIHSAFILQDFDKTEEMVEYSEQFDEFTELLNAEKLLHHYGDEVLMAKYGKVEGNILKIAKCTYNTVLLPNVINIDTTTVKMLMDFAVGGGKIYAIGDLPLYESGRKTETLEKLNTYIKRIGSLKELAETEPELKPVSVNVNGENCPTIHATLKDTKNGEKLLYIINNTTDTVGSSVEIKGEFVPYIMDLLAETEEIPCVSYKNGKTVFPFVFAEYGSAIVRLKEGKAENTEKPENEYIKLKKEFEISAMDKNAITLDKCKYRINGGEWQDELAVILLHKKALEMREPCDVEMEFDFNIKEEFDFASVEFCMEDPEKFDIKINGEAFDFEDSGEFIDHSIRRANIGKYLKMGVNKIYLSCRYYQSEDVYYAKFTNGIHETVLNKLTYDTELESVYLIGDFGVSMAEDYRLGERKCLHGGKTFALTAPKKTVDITNITEQNFWFFSGVMELSQNVNINKSEGKAYKIALSRLNAPAAEVYVNGTRAGIMAFAPFELDITNLLIDGENKITIAMLSGNRNLLGPHHKPIGESHYVGPATFTDTAGWTEDPDAPQWTDDYNFVIFGADI